jgi:hypothetical protein
VPQDIPSAFPAKDIQPKGVSLKVDKPPSPSVENTLPKTLNSPVSVDTGATSTPTSRLLVTRDVTPPISLHGQILPCIMMHPQLAESHLESGLMVDHNLVKALPCQGSGNNRDNIRVLQSPCGTTQTSFRLGSTLLNTCRHQ